MSLYKDRPCCIILDSVDGLLHMSDDRFLAIENVEFMKGAGAGHV